MYIFYLYCFSKASMTQENSILLQHKLSTLPGVVGVHYNAIKSKVSVYHSGILKELLNNVLDSFGNYKKLFHNYHLYI